MKVYVKYIVFVCLFMGIGMSKSLSQKDGSGSRKMVAIDHTVIEDDKEYKRKRAHKRKRKIRPRRNGF